MPAHLMSYAILVLIGGLLMLAGLHDIRLAEGLLGGALIGAALGFAGLLVGYYIVYFAGLLAHHRRYEQSRATTAA